MEIGMVGVDLAKHVFHAHGADASGAALFSKQLRRNKLLEFFARQSPCTVAMEACGGAHYWAREIGKQGHTVRLIPPKYVKPCGNQRRMMPLMRRISARLHSVRRCALLR